MHQAQALIGINSHLSALPYFLAIKSVSSIHSFEQGGRVFSPLSPFLSSVGGSFLFSPLLLFSFSNNQSQQLKAATNSHFQSFLSISRAFYFLSYFFLSFQTSTHNLNSSKQPSTSATHKHLTQAPRTSPSTHKPQ